MMKKKYLKVLVCGGRDYTDYKKVENILGKLLSVAKAAEQSLSVCHGAAKGADALVAKWCKLNKIKCTPFPANWNLYGKSAGPIRNLDMFTKFKPDVVIAFPGGSGTLHMVQLASRNTVVLFEIP